MVFSFLLAEVDQQVVHNLPRQLGFEPSAVPFPPPSREHADILLDLLSRVEQRVVVSVVGNIPQGRLVL